MLNVIEVTLDPAAVQKLAEAIRPLAESLDLSQLVKVPVLSAEHAEAIEKTYRLSSSLLRHYLGDAFDDTVKQFGQGQGNVLVINGLPWDERYADYAPSTHTGAPPTELIYFGLANLLGARGAYDLRLDYVRDGTDDNLHQDGAYRRPGLYDTTYRQTDFLAISCLHPGSTPGISTLYADFNAVINSLPADVVKVLRQDNFLPRNGNVFRPMIRKSASGWVLNPEFDRFNPFASGLMSSSGMVVRNQKAKDVLDRIKKVYPANDGSCYQVAWAPGKMVIANQTGVYHRRAGAPGVRSENRLLARARMFKSDGELRAWNQGGVAQETKLGDVAEFGAYIHRLLQDPTHQANFQHAKKQIAAWRAIAPQFDRKAVYEHFVAPQQPALHVGTAEPKALRAV